MKIAFVGKGGAGKSALTWLFAETLADQGKKVYVVDADHNMDTTANFGVSVTAATPTLHRSHHDVRTFLGLAPEARWQTLLNASDYPPPLTVHHSLWSSLWQPTTSEMVKLLTVGLGADDIIGSGKCAHGHSAPLKWLLPCLTTTSEEYVLIDGVAGVDMMNYGLFAGVDALIIIAEHHPNSERVAKHIIDLATKTKIPFVCVGNRTTPALPLPSVATFTPDNGLYTNNKTHTTLDNQRHVETVLRLITKRPIADMLQSLKETVVA